MMSLSTVPKTFEMSNPESHRTRTCCCLLFPFRARCLMQAVTSWVQAFAFDASNPQDDDGVDGDNQFSGGGFTSEGDGEGTEDDMAALQMECTVHEILLKNQVTAVKKLPYWCLCRCLFRLFLEASDKSRSRF